MDPADGQAAHVRRGVEVADQRLERVALYVRRRRDVLHEQLEEDLEAGRIGDLFGRQRGLAAAGVAVDDRERRSVLIVGSEVDEQVVDGVEHLGRAGIGPVDLVDDEHAQAGAPRAPCAARSGSGAGALAGVHEQEHAVDHREGTLHLAAEVGVPRRVDDVDR